MSYLNDEPRSEAGTWYAVVRKYEGGSSVGDKPWERRITHWSPERPVIIQDTDYIIQRPVGKAVLADGEEGNQS